MSQSEFNNKIESIMKGSNTEAAVLQAVKLCLEHPCYAEIWYDNLAK